MTDNSAPFLPDWASPPGDTLADMLDERSMTQTELAERLGVSLKHVNRIIKGAASISGELALGLEKIVGPSASFWMTREALYQADKSRQEQRRAFADAVEWAKQFPISELRKRGFIAADAIGGELVEQVLTFLGIAHPAQWRDPLAAYRKSQKFQSNPFALSAWLRQGEREAAEIDCAPYDEERFVAALSRARSFTRDDPDVWWPALQELCAAAGVAVVIVDTYVGAKANGATRWLSPHTALVQLSLRYAWEDIFWFTFFHEAGHVVLHRKKQRFVEVAPNDRPVDAESQRLENEADVFAARTLIPSVHEPHLRSLELGEIPRFAEGIGIGPAIVVGRLHHERLLPCSHGRHLRKQLQFAE